jgi:hypothetical protein
MILAVGLPIVLGISQKPSRLVSAERMYDVVEKVKVQPGTGPDDWTRSVVKSLERLRTDRVDLLQLHGMSWPDELAAWVLEAGVQTWLKLQGWKWSSASGPSPLHCASARSRQGMDRSYWPAWKVHRPRFTHSSLGAPVAPSASSRRR